MTYPADPEGMYPKDHPFWKGVRWSFHVEPPTEGPRQRWLAQQGLAPGDGTVGTLDSEPDARRQDDGQDDNEDEHGP